jgi:hypothetical protein
MKKQNRFLPSALTPNKPSLLKTACIATLVSLGIAIEMQASEIPLEESVPLEYSSQPLEFVQLPTETEAPYILDQITDVNQLRDVQPTDWAYEALRGLVERYGCIAGYPNGTFRGNRAITRYEFAAGLYSCLTQIERLIGQPGTETVDKTALATLQRLTAEFAAELATLNTQVDNLEARLGTVEENQFSTTTKLNGLVFFNFTGAFADGDVVAEGASAFGGGRDAITGLPTQRTITEDPNITFSDYLWLTFSTSFSGQDNLVVQLAAGNGDSPANQFVSAGLDNTFGVPFTDQRGAPGGAAANNNVILREALYQFPVTDNLRAVVGARINWYRYFDGNPYTFFLRGASSYNSSGSTLLNAIDRGSGAVLLWNVSDNTSFKAAYLGENTEFLPSGVFNTSSNPNKGIFNPTNTTTVQLELQPFDAATFRFIYNRSNIDAVGGSVGGAVSEPIYGFVDDGFGGAIEDPSADTFAFNFDWRLTSNLALFGRYSYGTTDIDPVTAGVSGGEVNAQSYQLGLAFPDLGKEGNLGTLSFLVPYDILDGEEFFVSGAGDGGTQYEIEATYYYPINRNLALVPAFYFIANPNNFEDNPNIYVGNLRMQFSF